MVILSSSVTTLRESPIQFLDLSPKKAKTMSSFPSIRQVIRLQVFHFMLYRILAEVLRQDRCLNVLTAWCLASFRRDMMLIFVFITSYRARFEKKYGEG